MKFETGSLVRARGREWVIQPDSSDELVILKPLGGSSDEITGVLKSLENIEGASFEMPIPQKAGDFLSCQLLRNAMLLGVRNGIGPFRSFGHLNVDPRPFQFVPLIMALRMDPVRLLIADDVGVGKTIEAIMIARELIDRGEVTRMTVLCPPHLAEQWQSELNEKFHIDAELVLSNTASKLERDIGYDSSLFDIYPFTVVSLDYIKNERRRSEFKRSCPELVIVDEVHTCTEDTSARGSHQQRWELLKEISKDPNRHIILLSATPHSGKEGNFRSLLSLLNEKFIGFPLDLSGDQNRRYREELSKYFIQRRRADVQYYMSEVLKDTGGSSPFPQREAGDLTWKLNEKYKVFLDDVISWAKEAVRGYTSNTKDIRERVRWWSALALLHTVSSSPAAAESTLRARSESVQFEDAAELDNIGIQTILDTDADELLFSSDETPDIVMQSLAEQLDKMWFHKMAGRAAALCGAEDPKLQAIIPYLRKMLKEGYQPIVFCRYISTAEYLEKELKSSLSDFKNLEVRAITGKIAPEEREDRIAELGKNEKRLLIATDCLSEGINLQQYFNAVIHYDLAWNPTRHEQREGRVDRYGQPCPIVRTVTYYGSENPVDGIILKVLLKKHENIRKTLGVSVPIPADGKLLADAIFESLLLQSSGRQYEQIALDIMMEKTIDIEKNWSKVAEQEKRSRTLFAQHSIQAKEVANIWNEVINSIGTDQAMEFVYSVCKQHSIPVAKKGQDTLEVDFGSFHAKNSGIAEAAQIKQQATLCFSMPAPDKAIYISRTHPIIEGIANHIFTDSFDSHPKTNASRCGVIRTKSVSIKTILVLIRARYLLTATKSRKTTKEMVAEDVFVTGWQGSGSNMAWLGDELIKRLLDIETTGNVLPEESREFLSRAMHDIRSQAAEFRKVINTRAIGFMNQHQSVRSATRAAGQTNVRVIETSEDMPVDIIGTYVLLPNNS